MPTISVIICTYNPEEAIFAKCLDAVSAACRNTAPLEIIIVDNNSSGQLDNQPYIKSFLQQHSQALLIKETAQGLTPARLAGIRSSAGDLLIFIDDDNFVTDNYFEVASGLIISHPFIGAFSGQVSLQYDKLPPEWTKKYWGMLIYRQLSKDVWSNMLFNSDTLPNGAGLCVSRDTADYYLKLFESGKRKFNLDRTKHSLLSGGDNDLAMCACDIGKGMGLFKDLHLHHFIPDRRFTLRYLTELAYGIYYSYTVLLYMREERFEESTVLNNMKMFVVMTLMNKKDRIILRSARKGSRDAATFIKSNKVIFK